MNIDHMAFIWIVLFVVLLIIETMTLNLTTIWFAIGALVAMIAAFIGTTFPIQIIVFLVTSFIVLVLIRPSVVKRYNAKLTKTNASGLVGKEAKIVETVNNDEMKGIAIINGQEWTARAVEDDMIIEEGTKATIVKIEGVKLFLTNKNN